MKLPDYASRQLGNALCIAGVTVEAGFYYLPTLERLAGDTLKVEVTVP